MTPALAAARRELERSIAKLEQDLAENPDFAALRRMERSPTAQSPEVLRQRQILARRLAALPLFQALQAISAAKHHVEAGDAAPGATDTRPDIATTEPDLREGAPDRRQVDDRPDATLHITPGKTGAPTGHATEAPPQPLTAIRGLTAAMAMGLRSIGVTRYEHIAAWTAADVHHVRTTLGLGRTISQRNWIEQAALLAMRAAAEVGGERGRPMQIATTASRTDQLGQQDAPVLAARTVIKEIDPIDVSAAIGTTEVVRAPVSPIRLRGLDADTMRAVAGAAAAKAVLETAELVARSTPAVTETASHAPTMIRLVEAIGTWPLPRPSKLPLPPPARTGAGTSGGHSEPMRANPTPKALADEPVTLIRGIDSDMAGTLAAMSEARFAAIAAWRSIDVARIAGLLDVPRRRISAESWIEQAAILASGRDTSYSRRVRDGELTALCRPPKAQPPIPARDQEPSPGTSRPSLIPSGGSQPSDVSEHRPRQGRSEHSLVQMIEDQLAATTRQAAAEEIGDKDSDVDGELEGVPEATVTIVQRLPEVRYTPMEPPPRLEVPRAAPSISVAEVARLVSAREQQRVRPGLPAIAGDEAVVEIVRRGELEASGTGQTTPPQRLPDTRLQPRSLVVARDRQAIWHDDRRDEASGVVRRFLRAIKRDA